MASCKQNIVVVDDDIAVGKALGRFLNAGGFCALVFNSAEAFLQTESAITSACLVMDIHLPGLSYFELRQRLIEQRVDPPTILMTAHDDPGLQSQAKAAGAIACLIKPFPGMELLRAIAKALRVDGFLKPDFQQLSAFRFGDQRARSKRVLSHPIQNTNKREAGAW